MILMKGKGRRIDLGSDSNVSFHTKLVNFSGVARLNFDYCDTFHDAATIVQTRY